MMRRMVDYSSCDSPYRSIKHQGDEYSSNIDDALRSLKARIRSCKADNNRLIKSYERLSRAQGKQSKVNEVILQSLSDSKK